MSKKKEKLLKVRYEGAVPQILIINNNELDIKKGDEIELTKKQLIELAALDFKIITKDRKRRK